VVLEPVKLLTAPLGNEAMQPASAALQTAVQVVAVESILGAPVV
jgi:hypothetical protein